MTKPGSGLRTKQARPPANEIDDDDNTSQLKYKNISKWFTKETIRSKNKDDCCQCPFKCGTCDLLKEYVKSRYEVVNILEDDSKLIFSPLF